MPTDSKVSLFVCDGIKSCFCIQYVIQWFLEFILSDSEKFKPIQIETFNNWNLEIKTHFHLCHSNLFICKLGEFLLITNFSWCDYLFEQKSLSIRMLSKTMEIKTKRNEKSNSIRILSPKRCRIVFLSRLRFSDSVSIIVQCVFEPNEWKVPRKMYWNNFPGRWWKRLEFHFCFEFRKFVTNEFDTISTILENGLILNYIIYFLLNNSE